MSNFSAEIQAKLNTNGIADEIRKIENNKINFKNISLDTTKLVSDIQTALNKNRFTINLDKVNMSSVTSQMQKSGSAAGKSFLTSFNSSLSPINTTTNNTANTIQHMQKTLASMKFDRSSIDLVTKDLQNMSLAIGNVTTRINGNNLNLSVRGIDELGRAVTIVKQFDYESGSISTVGKTISQSFDTGAAAAKRFEESAKKATTALSSGSVEASIAKVTAQYEKLGITGHTKLAEIKTDIQQLSILQTAMNNSKGASLVSNYEKFNETLAKVKSNLSVVTAESRTFVSSLQISTLDNKIVAWMNKNTKSSNKFGAALDDLRSRLASLDGSADGAAMKFNSINNEFNEIKSQAVAAGKVGSSLASNFQGAFKSILNYISVSTIIYQSISAIKQMYQNVRRNDSAMSELKKVSSATDSQLAMTFENAKNNAKEYAMSLSDMISATADWSRMGYSLSDAEELAKVSALYKNVGDNIDIETANQSLISTLQGFQLDASEAESIIDKFNEVANNYAIDSAGIGDALQRSAASFSAANTDLSKSIALITGTNEVVQDPDRVGNMWKTVSMRIRSTKQELEAAGEDTEGMVESTSELRDLVKGLTGFDIMADEAGTQFKDIYDIVVGIGEQWSKLSDVDQAGLLETLAGKMQGNALSAALNNVERIKKIYQTAEYESDGSAQKMKMQPF